jgi:predicted transcriptional regulator
MRLKIKKPDWASMVVKLTPAQKDVYACIPGSLEWVTTVEINDQLDYTRTTVLRALKRLFYLHMIHRDVSTIPYKWTRR